MNLLPEQVFTKMTPDKKNATPTQRRTKKRMKNDLIVVSSPRLIEQERKK